MSVKELNTAQLIEACLVQNQEAQLEIYNRYYKAMYNSAYRILKEGKEAEDVMQEAFLKAFTKLHTLENPALFGPWLKRIVINLSLNESKKRKRLQKVPVDQMEYSLTAEDDQDENSKEREKANKLFKMLSKLKDSYRIVLSLHFIEGYDYDEISDIMNTSTGNVRTLISRAKESLRKKLQVT